MIQYIFPLDNIDEGRRKINNYLFTGISATGYWNFLNSGSTGFSLEISGLTSSFPTNNADTSSNSNNIIIGTGNTVSGVGGYNFVDGFNNIIASSYNSFIFGHQNVLSGLTDSFVFGSGNYVYRGSQMTFISTNSTISSDTINNNYYSVLNSVSLNATKYPASINQRNTYFLSLNSSSARLSADTEFVSLLPGSSYTLSGTILNSTILGYSNSMGYEYPVASNLNHDNIFIFGDSLKPWLSATTTTPLSGTYINDLCIEDSFIFNKTSISLDTINKTGNTNFNQKNLYFLSPTGAGSAGLTALSEPLQNSSLTGIFMNLWINGVAGTKTLSGDSSIFIDTYGYNNRWDIPSNTLSANTVLLSYLPGLNKYVKYKG